MTAAITIHFREPALTANCIDNLLADGWAPILVWDNSADDGKTLHELESRFAGEERVQLVGSAVNLGFGKGMNAALEELGSRGYNGPVLLINNDALVQPGMYAALHERLTTSNVPLTLVAPRIEQDGKEHGWLFYQPWLALVTRRPLPGSFAYLSGCCLLVRRPDNKQSLFDEDFFMYGEDVELSWRMRRNGALLMLLDHSYLRHEGSASSGQASAAYERFLVDAHLRLAEKLSDNKVTALLMLFFRLPTLWVRACLRAWRFRSLVPLHAFVAGAKLGKEKKNQ